MRFYVYTMLACTLILKLIKGRQAHILRDVGFLGAGNHRRTNNINDTTINDTMKIKPTRLVKTDRQAESALIVFFSMIVGSLLLAIAIISHYL